MTVTAEAPAYGVVVFESTTAAYASEKALREAGIEARIVAVPRSLSTDCCLGVRLSWSRREQAMAVMRRRGIHYVGVYPYSTLS